MITRAEFEAARERAMGMLRSAGIVARPDEVEKIEVADLGLGEPEHIGLQILTLVNTEKISAKVIVMFPHQTGPEHKHPSLGDYEGKEETIRCQWGKLYLYTPGEPAPKPVASPPPRRKHTYTVWHEHILRPGDQVTLQPNTFHWFQGGSEGAVVWSFSTKATDLADIFSDPDMRRETVICDTTEE